jgi:hypothetical protein
LYFNEELQSKKARGVKEPKYSKQARCVRKLTCPVAKLREQVNCSVIPKSENARRK